MVVVVGVGLGKMFRLLQPVVQILGRGPEEVYKVEEGQSVRFSDREAAVRKGGAKEGKNSKRVEGVIRSSRDATRGADIY